MNCKYCGEPNCTACQSTLDVLTNGSLLTIQCLAVDIPVDRMRLIRRVLLVEELKKFNDPDE